MLNLNSIIKHLSIIQFYMIDSFKNDDDFLVVLIIMGAIFAFFAVIIALFLLVVFAALLFFLISGSVISASVLVGFQQKSTSKGFKTFFLIINVFSSIIASVLFFWIINAAKIGWPTEVSIFVGAIVGAIIGWVLGLLMFSAFRKITLFLKNKFQNRLKENEI